MRTIRSIKAYEPDCIRERFFKYLTHMEWMPGMDTPCWVFTQTSGNGYGRFCWPGMRSAVYVHRHLWECANGPVPKGLQLHHMCHNGRGGCCNPDHVVLVTAKQNSEERDLRNTRPSASHR
jgi:hypothetical protein